MVFRLFYALLHLCGRSYLIRRWGREFYIDYKENADRTLRDAIKKLPGKVDREFDLFYKFIAACIPIIYSLTDKAIDKKDAEMALWKMSESLFRYIPRRLMFFKRNSRAAIKRLRKYQAKDHQNMLGEDDWRLSVEENPDGSYVCHFKKCGAFTILNAYGYRNVFPGVCRIDYLMAHLAGVKFQRTETIGDGDDFCRFIIKGPGFTEWAPEKGFILRK